MSRNFLFMQFDLGAGIRNQGEKAHQAVEDLDADRLLTSSVADVISAFEEDFRINPVVIKEVEIQVEQQDTEVDVSGDPMRGFFEQTGPCYIKGTAIRFFVPFEGDSELLRARANTFSTNPPRAEVVGKDLIFEYTRTDHNAEAVKREFQNDLANLKKHLEWSRNQIDQFNKVLKPSLEGWVIARREKILRDRGMVASIGFPLRRRADLPQTYPVVQRKPAIARLQTPNQAFKPEPALEMAEYEHILSVVSNMVHVIERSPHAFAGMGEEDLRQHFLVQLNGHYEGQATGETFNFDGKTDILIRAEGKNVFIAECKFWKGPESLTKALDQLLGYTSWRDTKAAVFVFNRDRNFTTLLQKIPEIVRAHPQFKRQSEYKSESGFRFVLHHRDDKDREITITVVAFEVPA